MAWVPVDRVPMLSTRLTKTASLSRKVPLESWDPLSVAEPKRQRGAAPPSSAQTAKTPGSVTGDVRTGGGFPRVQG